MSQPRSLTPTPHQPADTVQHPHDDVVVEGPSPDLPAQGRGALAAGGLAGLAYWFAGWASFPDGPQVTTASAQQIRDHLTTTGSAIQVAAVAGMVGVAAAVVFVAALVRQIRDRLPQSMLAEVVFGAGILFIAYQWLVVTAEALLRLVPKLLDSVDIAAVDDQTVRGWYALIGFTHFMGDLAVVPTVVLLTAFSLAAKRGRLLPGWLVWVGLTISAAGLIGMVGILGEADALYPFWFVGLIGYYMWTLAASVTFLVRLRRTRPHLAAD